MTWDLYGLIASVLALFIASVIFIKQKKIILPIVFGLLSVVGWFLLISRLILFEHALALTVVVGLFVAFLSTGRGAQLATEGVGEGDVMDNGRRNNAQGAQEKKKGFLGQLFGKKAMPPGFAEEKQPQAPDILAKLAKESVNAPVDYNSIAHLKKRLLEVHEESAAAEGQEPSVQASAVADADKTTPPADSESGKKEESSMAELVQEKHGGPLEEIETDVHSPTYPSPLKLTPEEIKRILTSSAKGADDSLSLLALAAEHKAGREAEPTSAPAQGQGSVPELAQPPAPPLASHEEKTTSSSGDELDALIQQLSDASMPAEKESQSAYEDAYDFALPDLGEPMPHQEPLRESLPAEREMETGAGEDAALAGMQPIEEGVPRWEEPFTPEAQEEMEEHPAETASIDMRLREAGYILLSEYTIFHQISMANTTVPDFLLNNAYANSILFREDAVFAGAEATKKLLSEVDILEQTQQTERAIALLAQICAVSVDSEWTMRAYHLLQRLCHMIDDVTTQERALNQMLIKEKRILDMLG